MLFNVVFFLSQGHWRKVQEVGLASDYIENGKVRTLEWKVLSLSHVPRHRQDEAITHLETLQ